MNKKIEKAEKDYDKMQAKLDKQSKKGKLSEVDIQKENVKISKKQLQIKELEADLVDAKEKQLKLQK